MNSLRARLIVAFAVVALVPLAVATALLGARIESMIREQARERLGATLGSIERQVVAERARLAEQIAILGRDPSLKRLYLLRPSSDEEFAAYLAERRFLLGLDFLYVADRMGAIVSGVTPATGLAQGADAAILYQGETVGTVHGGALFDDAALTRLRAGGGVELVLRDGAGAVAATTLQPRIEPRRTGVTPNGRLVIGERSYWARQVSLEIGSAGSATLTGLVSTAPADEAVAALRTATLLLAAGCVALAILLGIFWSAQVSKPVERLAAFAGRVAEGSWDEPLHLRSVRELETLVDALDRMRRDLGVYRDRLVVSERHAAWSQMARSVAHEVKNPLTPIAISIADLKRSYEQGRPDFPAILDQAARTIADEVASLKRLLQEFSEFGRFPAPELAPFPLDELLGDLRALYAREIGEGRLRIEPASERLVVSADRGQLRQALVNLVLNGLDAAGAAGTVTVSASRGEREARLDVRDTGPGFTPDAKANLFVPGFTTKSQGSGLGLAVVERIVNEHGGSIAVESRPGAGATFHLRLPLAREG
ncbi:MAG TPA: ATP-binding protein [Candidatus Eisenbacteria bacterium]|nr:ATP-binding protein [Candidatus Eisenbacteria bacterium]